MWSAFERMVSYVQTYSSSNVCSKWSGSVDDLTGNNIFYSITQHLYPLSSTHRIYHSDSARVTIRGVPEGGMNNFTATNCRMFLVTQYVCDQIKMSFLRSFQVLLGRYS